MGDLYLDAYAKPDDNEYCYVSVYSAITLFVFNFCHADEQRLKLQFVTSIRTDKAEYQKQLVRQMKRSPKTVLQIPSQSAARYSVKLRLYQCRNFNWCQYKELPELVQGCELPAVVCSDRKLVISGLCSTLRCLVQIAQQSLETAVDCSFSECLTNLLGMHQNCLRACAEVSEWTLYTEVVLPELVEKVVCNLDMVGDDLWPELVQLENQLSKLPVEPSRRRNRKKRENKQSSDIAVFTVHAAENITERKYEKVDKPGKGMTFENLESDRAISVMKRFDNLRVVASTEEISGRCFVEGHNLQLTDLTIFVCIQLLFNSKNIERWCPHLHRIMSWYQRVATIPNIANAVRSTGLTEYYGKADNIAKCRLVPNSDHSQSAATNSAAFLKPAENDRLHSLAISEGIVSSPYSMHAKTTTKEQDCIQHTDKAKYHASQELIDSAIAKATGTGLLPEVLPLANDQCLQLPWEQYPGWVRPCTGGVPDKRAARKLQQLENVAAAVKEVVSARSSGSRSKGDTGTIVDFCSGGGHVGILLAYLFPQYKVILVENKEESVRRAVERISSSNCTNIEVIQCNLGRFHAPFDIGICLHACGVATDLVLAKCMSMSASVVISPCCYGSIRNTTSISYPLSDAFRSSGMEYLEYLFLGHAADQTEASTAKLEQGKRCMAIVDWDRCHLARERGYTVRFFVMSPPTCSPKNHILMGWPTVNAR